MRDKLRGECGLEWINNGEMAEWSNAAVLKTVVRLSVDRGFESLFLRQTHQIRPAANCCGSFVLCKVRTRLANMRTLNKTKDAQRTSDLMPLKLPPRGIADFVGRSRLCRPKSEGNPLLPQCDQPRYQL